MHRDFRLYLDDILDAIHQIQIYVEGLDEESFGSDRKTQDAVIRNLEIIGEAVGNLPNEIQDAATEIEWRKIRGLRKFSFMSTSASTSPSSGMWYRTNLVPLRQPAEKLKKPFNQKTSNRGARP